MQPKTVLLVDDSEDFHDLFGIAADEAGWVSRVHHLTSGSAALSFLQGATAAELPALILLDLSMPAPDGFAVLSSIKASTALRHVPVVVLSSSSYPGDVQRAYSAGASSFVCKPHGLAALIELARALQAYWFGPVLLPSGA